MPSISDVASGSEHGWHAHVGSRVVVRLRRDSGFRDVLGELLSADDGELRILTKRGETVLVRAADVVAGKPVPPRATRKGPPHLTLTTLQLEAVMAGHWRAPETERFGGWLLRAAGGFTGRANSVLPLGEPDRPAETAVADVAAWYRARGLRPRAAVPAPRPGDPDRDVLDRAAAAFTAAGWAPDLSHGAEVLTAPTGALLAPAAAPPDGLTITLLDAPDDGWLARYHYRGQALAEPGLRLLRSAPEQVFAAVRDGDATVAVARGSVGDAWAGVTAVEVAPEYRRRGLARLMLAHVAAWAWRRGAGSTFLQLGDANEAAERLYTSAGFTPHHTYAYLLPEP
jgi:GNAT superfamily N-acetyltransferase